MQTSRILAAAALALALVCPGCYAFTHHEEYDAFMAAIAADSTMMAIEVDNQNSENVRVLAGRNGNLIWLGTVSSMTQRTLQIPGNFPGGGGSLTFAVVALNGRRWFANGIFPRAGATLRLDVDMDIGMTTWSMR